MVFKLTKISVIIPVYNTASYLNECLNSVLNQTLGDFEVICIDDESTDSSLEILKSFKLKDERIKIITQSHMGQGAARNRGLTHACGEYVLFLDSDDYIDKFALEELYNIANQKSLDLIFYKLINFDNDTHDESKSKYLEMDFLKDIVSDEVFNWQNVMERIFDLSVTAPGKLFKKDLIKDLEFQEDVIFEDNLFFIKMIFKVKRAYFYDKYLYYRRIRKDSIMNSYFKQFSDCIVIYDRIGDYLKEINHYYEFSNQLFDRKCKDIFTRFSMVPDELKQDFHDKIKQNFLNKKEELQKDNVLNECSERSLKIYNSAIHSDSYTEFESSVKDFDLKRKNIRLKRKNELNERKYGRKISSIESGKKKYLNEVNNQNSFRYKLASFLSKLLKNQ